ncbi:MAG: M15 family metallopeptidase [Candidatus Pristimantibacillus sp.]
MIPHKEWSPVASPAERGLVRNKPKRSKLMTLMVLAMIAALVWSSLESFGLFSPSLNIASEPSESIPITALHPIVAAKEAELIAATKKIGITILITDSVRTNEEQDALYERGRSQDGAVVTNVRGGESYHNYGLAIDFALRTKEDKVIWDLEYDGNGNSKADWMEVVAIAKKLGFTWGGDWKNFRDYPHLQMDFGYSIRELQRGKRPPADAE